MQYAFAALHLQTDCAVCEAGYAQAIGYRCTACNNARKGTYVVLPLILALCVAAVSYLMYEMLDVGSTINEASSTIGAHCGVLSSILNKIKSIPWGKLRTPIVVLQILTQYLNITGLQMPDLYKVRVRIMCS
jgi:hypothetical protein